MIHAPWLRTITFALGLAAAASGSASADGDGAWAAIRAELFADRPIQDGTGVSN
jgi:hypothetical protein